MKADLYNQKAEKLGETELPDNVFGAKWNPDLVWQVAESERANQRQSSAHTKDRSEVRGGGKKPWRQKGTGRARHGSIRSPIWVGGGVTHGPRKEKIYARKINKKMRQRALAVILSQKMRDREILVLDDLSVSSGKTKDAFNIVKGLGGINGYAGIGYKAKALALLSANDTNTFRALRNIPKIDVMEARNTAAGDLLRSHYIILPENTVGLLAGRIK